MPDNKQILPIRFADSVEFLIPSFMDRPDISLDFSNIKEGESRLIEARAVNPSTYSDLEYCFNEGYREAKKNLTIVGYEIMQANKILRKLKSEYLLDDYPEFLKSKKLKDNASNRDGFLEMQEDFVKTQDRIDMLTSLSSLLDNKIRVFENVCRYMRKEIDITIRSGFSGNKYVK